jgi:hypothetical protein
MELSDGRQRKPPDGGAWSSRRGASRPFSLELPAWLPYLPQRGGISGRAPKTSPVTLNNPTPTDKTYGLDRMCSITPPVMCWFRLGPVLAVGLA